jgi:hypothetical protein
LDIGIHLDLIKNRNLNVQLQTAGRVLRKDVLNLKQCGYIIESFVNKGNNKMTAEKIIGYYQSILKLSGDKSNQNEYKELLKLCENMTFDETTKEIHLKIDDNDNHDIRLKYKFKTYEYNLNFFKKTKEEVLKKVKLDYTQKLKIFNHDLSNSKIKSCKLNGYVCKKLQYKPLFVELLKRTIEIKQEKIETVMKLTSCNYKMEQYNEHGFKWSNDIKVSIQGQDANLTFKNILKLIEYTNIELSLHIKLENTREIHYSYNGITENLSDDDINLKQQK